MTTRSQRKQRAAAVAESARKHHYFTAMPAETAKALWLEEDFIREAISPGNFGLASLAFRPYGTANRLAVYAGAIPDNGKSKPRGDSAYNVWDLPAIRQFAVEYGSDWAHATEMPSTVRGIDLFMLQTVDRLGRITVDVAESGPETRYTVTKAGFQYLTEHLGHQALAGSLTEIYDQVFAAAQNKPV